MLQLGSVSTAITVTTETETANVDTVTPTTLLSRTDIAQTPGADGKIPWPSSPTTFPVPT